MIDVYTWNTPNGVKIAIFLEEAALSYRNIAVNIAEGDQFEREFLRISPNNRIPAIVDPEGPDGEPYSLFESGAILMYLAEKTGQFLPDTARGRYDTLQWLMFQMGNVGPMLGQTNHFRHYAPEPIAYAVDRYTNEAGRLYGIIDRRLGETAWLAGDSYTIADMATWPWLRSWKRQGQNIDDFPHLKRWFEAVSQRPAVQRAIDLLAPLKSQLTDAKAREVLFGATQYQRR